MKTVISLVLVMFILMIGAAPTIAMTGFSGHEYYPQEDSSTVVNRPVNVQGLTGLIVTNSAYTQPRGSMVIGLSALAENSDAPDFSLVQGIVTLTGGITDRIEFGARMKLLAANLNSSGSRKTGLGDTDLLVKWRVTSAGETLPAVALGLACTLPTGDASNNLREIKHEAVRFMLIGSSEKEMPGDYFIGVYFEGQMVFNDRLSIHNDSAYSDTYGVINAGVLFPLTQSRRLQAIVEYNGVTKKDVLISYESGFSAVMPGLRYVTPNVNISFGVQFLHRDLTGSENSERYIGTFSYLF